MAPFPSSKPEPSEDAELSRARILIIDDDERETARVRSTLSPKFVCEAATTSESGLAAFNLQSFEIVIASATKEDAPASGSSMSALDLLDSMRLQAPDVAVILIGDDANISTVIEAGKHGAHDYIVRSKNDDMVDAISRSVDRAVAGLELRQSGLPPAPQGEIQAISGTNPVPRRSHVRAGAEPAIIGSSVSLANTLDAVDRVAHSSAPLLIVGETGTGKDLLAARIHARGPRRHRPYVVVNAGAIPAALLDSELFGHAAGSFTGATRARKGLVTEADGGTLFLDEITDLPIELQGRLLRVLESNAIRSVGTDHERHVDVRFLAATQRDLAHAVREHKFREDLYFRLNVLAIHVPALRDRREDLPALIGYFFDSARARNPRSPVREFTPAAYDWLLAWSWPGNVRELQAFTERLVVLGKAPAIELADVEPLGLSAGFASSSGRAAEATSLSRGKPPSDYPSIVAARDAAVTRGGPATLPTLREVTTSHVEAVLASTNGDKSRAAAILGIDISTLYRWRRRDA